MKTSIALTALCTLLAFVNSASSAEVRVLPRDQLSRMLDHPSEIEISGELDAQTPVQLKNAIKRAESNWISVSINSPGGSLLAGLEVGRILRQANATIDIRSGTGKESKPGVCFSACAYAYLGGSDRYIKEGSKYGVHRAYTNSNPAAGDLDTGQLIAAAVGAYIREMGVEPALLDLTVKRGRDGIYVLNKQELESLKVVNNGRRTPEWQIEATEGGNYLKGTQTTIYGTGKAVFFCAYGEIRMLSVYTAGPEKSKAIAQGGWHHSLMVDDDVIPLGTPVAVSAEGDYINVQFRLSKAMMRAVATGKKIGHAMQMAKDAPTFVGYQIDVPHSAKRRVSTYAMNCTL